MTREDFHARVINLDEERRRRERHDERRVRMELYPRPVTVLPLGASRAREYMTPDGDAA